MRTLLCCIGRKENQYIREYVEYYKKLGFTNICLYDNNYDGEEDFEDVIGDYVDSGFVFIKNYRNLSTCQLKAYEECYAEYHDKYDWIAYFDCDEFLTFTNHATIEEYLSDKMFDGYNAIKVNWMCYGDGGELRNDGRPLLERITTPVLPYDKHIGYNFPENNHIKSMVRCMNFDLKFMGNPHVTNITPQCNNAGIECSMTASPFNPFDYSYAYLRHFSTKTIDEYCDKMIKGFPDREWNIKKEAKFLTETRFFRYNEVTKEKVEIVKNRLGIDLSYLLPHEKYNGEKSNDVRIYSLCFAKKNFDFLDNKYVTPLQVGAANGTDVCELKDNTGDNISGGNFFYIENTGTYWIWKNIHGCKYKGQMQYRRPLAGIDNNTDFESIFKDYDVITCEPFHHPDHMKPTEEEQMVIPASTVEGGYAFSNCLTDLLSMEKLVKKAYPEYSKDWDKYIKNGPDLYYSNGFIMSEENFDKYCEFLFNCLGMWIGENGISNIFDLYVHVGRNLGAGRYIRFDDPFNVPSEAVKWQTSIGGFLSERLWTLWVQHNFKPERIYKLPYNKMEEGMYT